MGMLICPTLAAAHVQAAYSKAYGAGPPPSDQNEWGTVVSPQCHGLQVTVTPLRLEQAIEPIIIWTDRLDSRGKLTADTSRHGRGVTLRTSPERQFARYYYSKMVSLNGQVAAGWVEIPDRPYAVEFLKGNAR